MIMVSARPSSVAIDAIEKRLTELGKESRMNDVLKKAINETASKGKRDLWKGVKRTYTLEGFTAGDVKRKGYSARNHGAVLTVTGPVLGILENYESVPNINEDAAKARVFRSGMLKALEVHNSTSVYKAFVAKMKSGHVGIFQRIPGEYMKKHRPGRNTKGREAIKEIMSLSKAKAAEMVYEREGMYAELQEQLKFRLHKHMNAVIGGVE